MGSEGDVFMFARAYAHVYVCVCEDNIPAFKKRGFIMRQASVFIIKCAKHWETDTCLKQLLTTAEWAKGGLLEACHLASF